MTKRTTWAREEVRCLVHIWADDNICLETTKNIYIFCVIFCVLARAKISSLYDPVVES